MSDSLTTFGIGVVTGALLGVLLGIGIYYLVQRATIKIFDLKNT